MTEFFVDPVSVKIQPFFSKFEILFATSLIEPTGTHRKTKSASVTVSFKFSQISCELKISFSFFRTSVLESKILRLSHKWFSLIE